jgi:hypothetical protein
VKARDFTNIVSCFRRSADPVLSRAERRQSRARELDKRLASSSDSSNMEIQSKRSRRSAVPTPKVAEEATTTKRFAISCQC